VRSALPHLSPRWSALTAALVVIVTPTVVLAMILGLLALSGFGCVPDQPPPLPPRPPSSAK
jgi:hypothetical protein